jgi:hypothetical protein
MTKPFIGVVLITIRKTLYHLINYTLCFNSMIHFRHIFFPPIWCHYLKRISSNNSRYSMHLPLPSWLGDPKNCHGLCNQLHLTCYDVSITVDVQYLQWPFKTSINSWIFIWNVFTRNQNHVNMKLKCLRWKVNLFKGTMK